MGTWDHIILEAFCTYNFRKQKKHKFCDGKQLEKSLKDPNYKIKWETKKNELYTDPKLRPKWCVNNNKKRIPKFRCLINGKHDKKCEFLSVCNADRKDYKIFYKAWKEAYDPENP